MPTDRDAARERSGWPYGSLFWMGYFGPDSHAGKALRWRVTFGLLLTAFGPAFGRLPTWPPGRAAGALLAPLGIVLVVWAYARYLASLDELRRLIQLEALALSYGTVMVLGAFWLGFNVTDFAFASSTAGGMVFYSLLLAEIVRGVILVVLARRRV